MPFPFEYCNIFKFERINKFIRNYYSLNYTGQSVLLISKIIMSQTPNHQSIPSFLLKLEQILSTPSYAHIIRWDKSGKSICICCVQNLEEQVLPKYFRHGKFASFVRQLNIYGFHKKKSEKSMDKCFANEHFSRGCINFSALVKRSKKEGKDQVIKENMSHSSKEGYSEQTFHEIISQLEEESSKNCHSNQQAKLYATSEIQIPMKIQEVNELIEEFTLKVQPYLDSFGLESYLELEKLLRDPRYQQINEVACQMIDQQWINTYVDLPKGNLNWKEMEFIL